MSPPATDFIAMEARFGAQNCQDQGHCHPKILAAMIEQAGKLT